VRSRNLAFGVLAAVVAGGGLLAVALRPSPSSTPRDAPTPTIPLAPPAARAPAGGPSGAEVAAAYRAWLTGDARAKGMFAELVAKTGRTVEPGLPDPAALVVTPHGDGALIRDEHDDLGVLFADGATGKVLAWTPQGGAVFLGEELGPFLFEEKADGVTAAFDAKALLARPDVPGKPVAGSADGAIVLYVPNEAHAGTDARPEVARTWDARAGKDVAVLRYEGGTADAGASEDDGAPSLASSLATSAALLSRDGRWVVALVDVPAAPEAGRFVVWDGTTGRTVASRPVQTMYLAAAFASDEKALFAVFDASDKRVLVKVRLPDGAIEGPIVESERETATPDTSSIAVSADGKLVAVGAGDRARVFDTAPLRFAWKTPQLRADGPPDDDLGAAVPRFVLGGRALFVTWTAPPSGALYRTNDHAELARAPFADVGSDALPVTRSFGDARAVLLLDEGAGPYVATFDAALAVKKRTLSADEREGNATIPELAGAPPDDENAAAIERARAAIGKAVCHAGDLVMPRDVCP
jgi:hypothetical protein